MTSEVVRVIRVSGSGAVLLIGAAVKEGSVKIYLTRRIVGMLESIDRRRTKE
jgi:hypothetical protein